MTSLTDLREVVDVVIGVDTHVHTHSAAVVDAATGGVRGEITIEATAEGHAELVEFAGEHDTLQAWAIEGTGGHGAGLSRHLLGLDELEHGSWGVAAPVLGIRGARSVVSVGS
jgi:transposase